MLDSTITTSLATLHRMPLYLKLLREKQSEGTENISSVVIADALGLNASLVKKDLSFAIVSEGKPKVGYSIKELIFDIESFLGYNNTKEAIVVGTGRLGQALMGFKGFEQYGLNIIAGFDIDNKIIGTEIAGKKILPTGKMESLIKKLNIKIAVLTIPQENAQIMADALIAAGIRAIWNFTMMNIVVPSGVVIKNENMAASLAVLSNQMKEILMKDIGD